MKYIKITNILTTLIFLFVLHQSYSQSDNSTTEKSIDYDKNDNNPDPVEVQMGEDTIEQNNATDSCPHGFFQCLNHQCIDGNYTCDNITQCSDGSDEGDEICRTNSTTIRSTIIISTAVTTTFTKSDKMEPYEASGSVTISQTSKTTAIATTEKIPTTNETTDVPVYDSTIVVETQMSSHHNWLLLIIILSIVVVSILVLSIIVIVFLCKGISKKTGVYNL